MGPWCAWAPILCHSTPNEHGEVKPWENRWRDVPVADEHVQDIYGVTPGKAEKGKDPKFYTQNTNGLPSILGACEHASLLHCSLIC